MPMQNSLTPYRKRSASKAIKRKYARRRLFAPNEVSAIRMPAPRVAGFPDKLRTTIKYIEYVQLDAGATTVAKAQYRMNGLVDPTVAVGGHQPLGRDQYATFYNRYRVTKVKALIVAGSITTYAGGAIKLVVVPDNATNILSDMIQAQEQRGASVHVSPASNTGPVICRRTFYPHQITGVTATEYKDDRFQSLINTKPTEDIMLHVLIP